MSDNNQNTGVSVNGDGNIIGGTKNRTYVDKRTTIINQLHGNKGGNNGGKSNNNRPDEPGEALGKLFAMGLAFIFVVAYATLTFCLHAPLIYSVLKTTAVATGVITILITLWLQGRSADSWQWWQLICLIGVCLAGYTVWLSSAAFPPEATALAIQAADYKMSAWKVFLCNLSTDGIRITSHQMISTAILSAGALALAVFVQLLALSRGVFELTGWLFAARIATIQKLWMSGVCIAFGIAAFVSQTDMAYAAWAEVINSPALVKLVDGACTRP